MITATLVGERELIARLTAMPAAIHDEVVRTVQRLGYAVEARSKAGYLTGPRPQHLGVVTGRLRGSISHGAADSRSRLEESGSAVYYYVGTNVGYGKLWEEGFMRRIGAGARGGPRTLTGKSLASYIARHPPGTRAVAARPFLAPALHDLQDRILHELGAALTSAVQKGGA